MWAAKSLRVIKIICYLWIHFYKPPFFLPPKCALNEWQRAHAVLLLLLQVIQRFSNFLNEKKNQIHKKCSLTTLAEGLRPYSGCDTTHLCDCFLFQHTLELSRIGFASIPNSAGTALSQVLWWSKRIHHWSLIQGNRWCKWKYPNGNNLIWMSCGNLPLRTLPSKSSPRPQDRKTQSLKIEYAQNCVV